MAYGNTQNESSRIKFRITSSTDDRGRKHAMFSLSAKEGDKDAKQVMGKDGTPYLDGEGKGRWKTDYTFVEGFIVDFVKEDVEVTKGTTRTYLNIQMMDGSDSYTVSVEKGSRYWLDFLKRLPSVDLSKKVHMSPYSIEENGKWNQGIVIHQEGVKVVSAYNKENNYGGAPQATKVSINNKEVWDFGPRDTWMVANSLMPAYNRLKELNAANPLSTIVHDAAPQATPQPVAQPTPAPVQSAAAVTAQQKAIDMLKPSQDLNNPASIAAGFSADIGGDQSVMPPAPSITEDMDPGEPEEDLSDPPF